MSFEVWLAYTLAVTALIAVPGPTILMIIAHGLAHGGRRTLATIAGVELANASHVVIAAAGLSAILALSAAAFAVVKWAGVAYLVWLGIRQWRAPAGFAAGADAAPVRRQALFAQGFAVTILNPKSIAFYLAFFPQFIDPGRPRLDQFVVVGATFFAVSLIIGTLYAFFAGAVKRWFLVRTRMRWLNRITGSILIGAGAVLALVRRTEAA